MMIKIIPKTGLKVIDPSTMKAVPEDGITIRKLNTYWEARKKDGDIKTEELKTPRKTEVRQNDI